MPVILSFRGIYCGIQALRVSKPDQMYTAMTTRDTILQPYPRYIALAALFNTVLLVNTTAWAEPTRYVTDQLEITLRSGQSTKHQIIRMLPSGQPVELLEIDDETRYSRVRTSDGEEGWVISRYLDEQPSGRERLQRVQQQLDQQTQKTEQLTKTLAQLRQDNKKLESELSTNNKQNSQYEQELNHIKKVSANTITIDNENQNLKTQLQQLQSDYNTAQQQIAALKSSAERDWFMIGAGVILLGIFIGLIIPKIRWKKKSDWGTL